MRSRRGPAVFGLSFLDAITCGFGAVILFFMIISSRVGERREELTDYRRAEVDRLETTVLDEQKNLVQLRNATRRTEAEVTEARGLTRRIIEQLKRTEVELATYEGSTLARTEHVNRLKTDLRTLEDEAKRLSASRVTDEAPGERVRAFTGDGNRQYLTGLKLGGERVLILVDASASMLDETIVNIVRRRNLPDRQKLASKKWRQTVKTVDWLTTQLPRDGQFQIFTFNERATPLLEQGDGAWLDAGDGELLDAAVRTLGRTIPQKGTSLWHAFGVIAQLEPAPDNVILLTDGLPTQGQSPPRGRTVSAKDRLKLFNRAVERVPRRVPMNVILFPVEGDPMAASAFWKLALATRGSCLSPSEGWP